VGEGWCYATPDGCGGGWWPKMVLNQGRGLLVTK